MFGVGRGVTPMLVGWLWADLLLGLFVIFLAASAAPSREPPQAETATAPQRAVDPHPIEITIPIDGTALLSADEITVGREELRIVEVVTRRLFTTSGSRQVAVALAFASHEDAVLGDRLARLATDALRGGIFDAAVVKPYHSIVAGDRGSSLTLELYLYR